MTRKFTLRSVWLFMLCASLTACGGGGAGGGGGAPTGVPYTIGGTVIGLGGGKSAVLQNNTGNNLTITTNGAFTFSATVMAGGTYAVRVLSQPASQVCNVSDGNGTVGSANITNVVVICVDTASPAVNPDTGITASQCFHNGMNAPMDIFVACDSVEATTLYSRQDGMTGRDANVATNDNADGKLGFSFSTVAGGCVQDNVTGLMWEVKTNVGGLRDKDNLYTNLGDGAASDTSGYVTAVNGTDLCGFNDWRLPSADELHSIVDYGTFAPAIDATWFPNTVNSLYWSASSSLSNSGSAWNVSFQQGDIDTNSRTITLYVRLVRGAPAGAASYTISSDGQEVTDQQTGLIWRRCVEGMSWNGSTCSGTFMNFGLVESAFARATSQAGSDGWRLPNIKELASIVDRNFSNPAIDPSVFPGIPVDPLFWSVTPLISGPAFAWGVGFNSGGVSTLNRQDGYKVRLVRDSQ